MDCAEKKDVRPDQIDKVDIKDPDNLTGKYVSKARKMVSKTFAKRALQWSAFIHLTNKPRLYPKDQAKPILLTSLKIDA